MATAATKRQKMSTSEGKAAGSSSSSGGKWSGPHLTTVTKLTRADIESIFAVADRMLEDVRSEAGGNQLLAGKILANIFYEPSTRTSASFAAAMMRCGGKVMQIDSQTSSAKKGESIGDTIRCLECYTDVMVLRHPMKGSTAEAASFASKPLLSAGDGAGEHPTQALLDLYTIRRELGRLDDIQVTLLGDLKHGRTVHSLAKVLTLFDNVAINYVSPAELAMPQEVQDLVSTTNPALKQTTCATLAEALPTTDVLYVTRIQRERFESADEYEKCKGSYVVSRETLAPVG